MRSTHTTFAIDVLGTPALVPFPETPERVGTLQLSQNAVVHVLTRCIIRDHISPILASLHWFPVKFRVQFVFTYKAIHGQSPSYLEQLIVPYRPSRTLRSQDAGLLVIPRISKSRMGGRAFS